MIMSGQRKAPEPRPYMVSEIPEVKIDYRGLITYAKSIKRMQIIRKERSAKQKRISLSPILLYKK